MNNQKAIIEGLLFLSGDEGLSLEQIQGTLNQENKASILADIELLEKEYASQTKGIELVEYASRYKFVTKEFVYPYGEKLLLRKNL